MLQHVFSAALVVWLIPLNAYSQSLTGLRIEGPEEVIENTFTPYSVIAEFDNGMEFDVTVSASLWVEPGTFADIDLFGLFEAHEVDADQMEVINASYSFGLDVETATLDVTIFDLGPAGYALDFDGVDDYVRVPRAAVLEPAEELTIEVWVRPDTIGSRNSRIIRNHGSGGYILAWRQDYDSHIGLRLHNATSWVAITDPDSTEAYLGQWIHIAGVYSANGDFGKLYVDGVLKAERYGLGLGPVTYSGQDLQFGNWEPFAREDFDGSIDEVRIWNVARNYCDIRGNMNRRLHGNEPGLVGYWRMDEADGQRVYDSSPFGNDGTLGTSAALEANDPQWVESGADLSLDPFPPIAWTDPEYVPEISTATDRQVSVSADGLEIYLSTERAGLAQTDIYRAERAAVSDDFSQPLLVPELSVTGYGYHDNSPCLSSNGLRLYMMRHEGYGPGDLFVAERDSLDSPWGQAVAIESLNTEGSEWAMAVSGDELEAAFLSDRSGQMRYWAASRTTLTDPWDNFALIDSLYGFAPVNCALTHDGLTIYAAAQGPGGLGGPDIWRTSRPSKTAAFGEPSLVLDLSSEHDENDVSFTGDGQMAYIARDRSYYVAEVAIPGGPVDGEMDCDGDVDLDDFTEFTACMTGPGGGVLQGCDPVDYQADVDVDLADYHHLLELFTGPR